MNQHFSKILLKCGILNDNVFNIQTKINKILHIFLTFSFQALLGTSPV